MNETPRKYKIALIGYMLSNGGAERVLSTLSQYLHKNNFEVHTIIMIDQVTYNYGGKLLNLGKLRSKSNGLFNKINRFITFKKYVNQQNFDLLIDFRFRVVYFQEFFIYKFIYKLPKIQTVHSGRYESYLFKYKVLSNYIFRDFNKIITVSKGQQQLIERELNFSNLETIYNPVDIDEIKTMSNSQKSDEFDFEYIVAVGRLSVTKQFCKLIEAYLLSDLLSSNIHLVIVGDGPELENLEKLIQKTSSSKYIHLAGQIDYPYVIIRHAKFLVQSSLFEGLPMVLIESLCCETPVVAFDCFSGPNEIIIDGQNGILVENQNLKLLIAALNKMAFDKEFYYYCKSNSINSIKKFDVKIIGLQWQKLILEIIKNENNS
ncbi:glycosyltransferase [Flavobacterium sp. W20_MBD1_R3]|uniref:glycosyltransferase n=1 Tax=Flavobacterium sp. W20_MBD1_R3 TaxID=3240278 RepID=UPI003F90C235